MIGCGNAMREPLPAVLDRIRREVETGDGNLCVCMERRGRVVLTSTGNALPSELLVTIQRGAPDALQVAGEAVVAELLDRLTSPRARR